MQTFILSILLILTSPKSSDLLPPKTLNNFLLPPTTSQPFFELPVPTTQPYFFSEKNEILDLKLKILELELKIDLLELLFELHENQHKAAPKFTPEKSMKT